MKLHILSDLHLEVSKMPDYKPPEDIDLVILAGHLSLSQYHLESITELAKTFSWIAFLSTLVYICLASRWCIQW